MRTRNTISLPSSLTVSLNLEYSTKKENTRNCRDFPGGAVENPPADAGDIGFEPWVRKIPHAMEQLSPCSTTTEPVL